MVRRLWLTVAACGGLGFMAWSSVHAEPDGWQAMTGWARAQRRTRLAGELAIPVLWGDTRGGSRRDGLRVACALGDKVAGEVDGEALRLASSDQPRTDGADERVATSLAALAPAIAALRDAVHRVGEPLGVPGEEGGPTVANLFDLLTVVDGLLVASRAAGDHEPRAAIEGLLDAMAVGVTCARLPTVVEKALGGLIVERAAAAIDDAVLQRADATLRAELAVALERADGVLATAGVVEDCAAEAVLLVVERTHLAPEDVGMASFLQAWRHGFSVRESAKARTTLLARQVGALVAATPRGERWPAREPRLAAFEAADAAANSDLAFPPGSGVRAAEEQLRRGLAAVRLLRLVAACHDGRELVLADPLGAGDLVVRSDDDSVTFASAVADLVRRARRPR